MVSAYASHISCDLTTRFDFLFNSTSPVTFVKKGVTDRTFTYRDEKRRDRQDKKACGAPLS
jgi:hypothetical protein